MTTCKDCNGTKLYIGAGLYPPEPCKTCTKDTKHDCAEVYTFVDFLNASGKCVYYDPAADKTYFRVGGHTPPNTAVKPV